MNVVRNINDIKINNQFVYNAFFDKVEPYNIPYKNPPGNPPHPLAQYVLVGFLNDSTKCPWCYSLLIAVGLSKRRCLTCHNYVAFKGETISDISHTRATQAVYTYDLDTPKKPILFKYNELLLYPGVCPTQLFICPEESVD